MRHFALLALLASAMLPGTLVRCAPSARVCVLSAPTPPDWRLVADGTKLKDGLGRIVFLRGVNAGGRSKFAPYVPFDFTDYATSLAQYMDHAVAWGIDAFRVPFTWAALEPTQGQDDAAWLARYDQFLDAAWARGIWTVVDFHQDVYAEAFCGDGFPAWTLQNPPAPHHDCPQWSLEYFGDANVTAAFDAFWAPGSTVQVAYAAAWDRMVARYKDKPGVLGFEPINEPGWGSADEATFAATTLTDFFTIMVARMRAAAPTSLVFVDPPGLDGVASVTQMKRPIGDGMVFAPHFYPLGENVDEPLPGLQKWADVGAAWNVPVFVGEFGANNTLDGTLPYMSAHFAALDSLGMGGTLWEYSVATELWNSEKNSVVTSDGTELPVAQALIRVFARTVAGDSITQTFSADTRAYDLAYVPKTGVTEIQFPARAYASGYDIKLEGGCYDASSSPGRILVSADATAAQVTLHIAPR